jgi:hypothetical protein
MAKKVTIAPTDNRPIIPKDSAHVLGDNVCAIKLARCAHTLSLWNSSQSYHCHIGFRIRTSATAKTAVAAIWVASATRFEA